ncbi:9104_t:CDS:2 [Funneliformis geosporum]|nr:9104_t:CDS:2 [Funneliformis geosporum]
MATDYMTKWSGAKALPNTKAASVISFFYKDIICYYRCLKEYLTVKFTNNNKNDWNTFIPLTLFAY